MVVPEIVSAVSITAIITTAVVVVMGILAVAGVNILNAQNTSASLSQLVEAAAVNRGIEQSKPDNGQNGNTTNVTTNDGN